MERRFRWATPSDYDVLGEVMFDAVRNGPSQYSESQRQAWVPAPRSGPAWSDRLSRQEVIVAEIGTTVVGFMSLAEGGYIDFAYIRPEAQHTGLFRQLLEHVQARACERAWESLWVHASLMAQPAFAALGFQVTKQEEVTIGAERFERFVMEKTLATSNGSAIVS